jgi:uncharacterized protein YqeY
MLKDTFKEKSNEALRSKDTETRRIMNNILSKFLEVEKSGTFTGWTEALEQDTIRAYIKALQKSMEQMKGSPLTESYQREIDVLSAFLPKGLSEDEVRALVAPYAANAKGLGPFIGAVMKDHRGRIDPEMLRRIGAELGLK